MKGPEIYGALGLTEDAEPEGVDARYKEVKAFLGSDQIPASLGIWAQQQNAHLDEAYLAFGRIAREPEEDVEEGLDDEEAHKVKAAGVRAGRSRSILQSNLLLASAGALIGLVILGVVLWQTGTIGGKSNNSAGTNDQFDPAQYLASQQATLKQLEATVAANPNNTDALFQLGETNFTGEQWQQAIDWFTRLIALDPQNAHAVTDIGTANFNLGRYADAKAAWQKALEIAPGEGQVHYNLGFLYAFGPDKDTKVAKEHWAEVVRVASDSDLAKTAQVHIDSLPDQ